SPLESWREHDGRLLRLRLARPKANIVDAAMIAALDAALAEARDDSALKGVLLDHQGPHFSFGASVEEHLPGQCADMLRGLHALVRRMVEFPVPILVAVRGQCLGGGLEVAAAGHLMFVAPDASLGQPEIRIGVFAPAASCLLPERVARVHAEDLLFSGRAVDGAEAARIGLANAAADDPEAAALDYFTKHLASHSASSLRFAVTAAHAGAASRIKARLDEVEALYLEGLMATHDATEGLRAFIEKRPANWENR
ncbi:MAG: cyclohexa-1,5-dienecarbonyl-CoA hydratase, partial [Gammaproteobacteria bacterium]|nr:cyclohexa-1,5-dienecarbonyl-CoA hydratase [Gammaproteobacteria bacterium]